MIARGTIGGAMDGDVNFKSGILMMSMFFWIDILKMHRKSIKNPSNIHKNVGLNAIENPSKIHPKST